MSARTYWLSFCDEHKQKGQQFLGVAIVDVTEEDAAAEVTTLNPEAQDGAEWIAAACRKAWREQCNPGGQVLTLDITGDDEATPLPRHRLLNREELIALGVSV